MFFKTLLFILITFLSSSIIAQESNTIKTSYTPCKSTLYGLVDCPEGDQSCFNKRLEEKFDSNFVFPPNINKSVLNEKRGVAVFIITKEGKIENIKMEKSIHPQIDDAVINAIMKFNELNWIPSSQGCTPIDFRMSFPVKFSLK